MDKKPNKILNPDEAVATLIQGAIANNIEDKGLVLRDVTTLSLGLELYNGVIDILIPRNTTIPFKNVKKYKTIKDNQEFIILKFYQGERKLAKENKFLGKLQINIPPKPRGKVRIEVTFALDINGVLKVSAKDTAGGETTNLDIKMDNVMDEANNDVLGIDLGTTYSCVAIWKNGKAEIIPNQETGNRITPSVVSFTKKDRIVGDAAKNQAIRNYKNTVYDAKRLIGRDYDDPEVQKDIKLWPFKVIKGDNNKPKIQVEYKGKIETFYPEEISACILSKLKQNAKDYLGYEVNDAIITCPAYFDDLQRKATQMAGKIAGLNVLRIINEPTAAAIAYGLDKDNQGEKNILIFDLGSRTFDVTILSIDNNLLEVRSTCGDTHLGGEDFDNRLLQFCIEEFKKQTGIDISYNQKAIIRLKILCEKSKINLSSMQETTMDIDALAEGEDFNITITRPEFEELCKEDFNKCIQIVENALKDAYLTKDKIDDVILVGGSTRIPKIQQIVKDYFGKEPNKKLHPDEAVAIGAAIQGAIANNVEGDGLERLVLLDVTPLSLGIGSYKGIMTKLIYRNTTIPCEKVEIYQTIRDSQNTIAIGIYQGERKLAKENKFLGKLYINNPSKPRGKVRIEVTFALDINVF